MAAQATFGSGGGSRRMITVESPVYAAELARGIERMGGDTGTVTVGTLVTPPFWLAAGEYCGLKAFHDWTGNNIDVRGAGKKGSFVVVVGRVDVTSRGEAAG